MKGLRQRTVRAGARNLFGLLGLGVAATLVSVSLYQDGEARQLNRTAAPSLASARSEIAHSASIVPTAPAIDVGRPRQAEIVHSVNPPELASAHPPTRKPRAELTVGAEPRPPRQAVDPRDLPRIEIRPGERTDVVELPHRRRPLVGHATLTNDFFTFNSIDDDLYTSAAEIEIELGLFALDFKENAFTDSVHGLRFDETYLAVRRELPLGRHWGSRLSLGVVRVGDGLLGERAQNAVHRAINDQEVEIPYLDETHHFGTFGLEISRRWQLGPRIDLTPVFVARSAPGLQESLLAQVTARWRPTSSLGIRLGAGVRYSYADFEPLKPWVGGIAPTWELALELPYRLELALTANDYGTRRQHFLISYRAPVGAPRRTGSDGASDRLFSEAADSPRNRR